MARHDYHPKTPKKSSAPAGPKASPTRFFTDLTRADVPWAGGKGANLGEMTHAGVPVPPGFVVGAPTYAAFVDETGLRERLAALLDGLDVDDTAELERRAVEARRWCAAKTMPRWIRKAIMDAYEQVCEGEAGAPVAVRSSATAEDTEAASFAGMNETFLNIKGGDSVADAVRRCWASLFGARTVFYRAKRGFSQTDIDIAVVVQRQIQSTRSGVMFTINPASGDRDELVIEGSFGLGEAVVSGSVSPDRYVVDKQTLNQGARHQGQGARDRVQARRRHRDARARGRRGDAADADRRRGARAGRAGRRIEEHYGAPRTPSGRSTPTARRGCFSRGR